MPGTSTRITKTFFIVCLTILCHSIKAQAQIDTLQRQIQQLIRDKKARVGVSIRHLRTGQQLSINGGEHFPMQSVFKFPIALAVLDQVDKGNLSLNQKIYLKKGDLRPDTWSPMRDDYRNGNSIVFLSEVLRYTVSQSDNNGCDILLRLIGGTEKVNEYLQDKGIEDIKVQASELEMTKAWEIQFSNWATPDAMTGLLQAFYNQKLLSKDRFDFLWEAMLKTSTGPDRLKGQLPEGTWVAHKTGTSDTNKKGITAAFNDAGIIRLPDGSFVAICVFITDSKEKEAQNAAIIAGIARLAWDHFTTTGK